MSKYKLDLPPTPDGQDFARDSFWWTYRERFAMRMKFGWKVRPTAFEWFDREQNTARLEGKPFPPVPIFRRVSSLPMPSDGKDEKPGRVPRTGKH